jgi:hypothetical protein
MQSTELTRHFRDQVGCKTLLEQLRVICSPFQRRKLCIFAIVIVFVVSRLVYYAMGVRFDTEPLAFFWQLIDPVLLRDAPWQSLFYQRTQMPGFNLYIAVMTHIFPRHADAAFQGVYLSLGLILGIALFFLLDRLHVNRALALFIAVICIASPVTVLYENWLFYEYPLAVLFCIAALFLHSYASTHSRLDGTIFFCSIALIALIRAIFHLVWFFAIVALVLYAIPKCRRRTALSAAVPAALLAVIYLKSLLLFGMWMPGSDVYGGVVLANVAYFGVPRDVLLHMSGGKTISSISLHGFDFQDNQLVSIVPLPPKTGIPILDERVKSTGRINMDSLWMAAVGKQLRRDGLAILRAHPAAALIGFRNNVEQYFLPADIGWPFGGIQLRNMDVLLPLLRRFDLVIAGKSPAHNYAPVAYLAIPLLLCFGMIRSARWLRRAIGRQNGNPRDLVVFFAFANIAYLSAIVILYDFTDQNRILFEVFPLFIILLGSLIVFLTRWLRLSRSASHRIRKAASDRHLLHQNVFSGD